MDTQGGGEGVYYRWSRILGALRCLIASIIHISIWKDLSTTSVLGCMMANSIIFNVLMVF